MSKTVSPSQTLFEEIQHQLSPIHSKTKHTSLTNKNPSLISVDYHSIPSDSDDTLNDIRNDDNQTRGTLNSSSTLDVTPASRHRSIITSERQCSLTQMLLVYAQQEVDASIHPRPTRSDHNLVNILNVLELHFNTYADDKRQIYFEGIFQILHDFKEQITEFLLIETMQLLQIDPLAPCNFENFILILCHLPPIKQDSHVFLNAFNELDYNKDSYITFEDIHFILPHLTSYFDEEIVRAAIHIIDTDHDNDRLSYFDFVTSLIALQEYRSTIKTHTLTSKSSRINTDQKKI